MKIGTFWLKEFDLDGFKIDGVELYFDAESVSETNKWWKEFHSEMKNQSRFLSGRKCNFR